MSLKRPDLTDAELREALAKIRADFKETGELWTDADFPPNETSIQKATKNPIVWKRPKEICAQANFISGGVSRHDVVQGALGNCWVLTAISSLSMYPELLYKVVPEEQGFAENYIGAFHFRFWQFGVWVNVLVDDHLPSVNNKLVFLSSSDKTEFWSALLEKAYAKLNGNYGNLVKGAQTESLTDFTGGICESIFIANIEEPKLLEQMLLANKMCSLMGCSIKEDEKILEAKLPNGLVRGHAYSITDVRKVKGESKDFHLVRLRNPWANSFEWNGAFSDGSKEWDEISEAEKKAMSVAFNKDGEFWMSFEDFYSIFYRIYVCHLGPQSISADQVDGQVVRTRWSTNIFNGQWIKGVNAGGCRNLKETYATNPQYFFRLDSQGSESPIIIELAQKNLRFRKIKAFYIGYCIYQVPADHTGRLDREFLFSKPPTAKYPKSINQREIILRHVLPSGCYVIIPNTFDVNQEVEFSLRIFSIIRITAGIEDEKSKMTFPKVKLPDSDIGQAKLKELEEKFILAAGNNKTFIKANQLKTIIDTWVTKNEMKNFTGFHLEICRSLLALKDSNVSGRLELNEFNDLWIDFQYWKTIFLSGCNKKSGEVDINHFRELLEQTGFIVDGDVYRALVCRYTDPDSGQVTFTDYLLCVCRLKNAFNVYRQKNKTSTGERMFTKSEYLKRSLYT